MGNELKEKQQAFQKEASLLGDYQALDKTQLANGYCDAEEAMWKAQEEGDEVEATKQSTLRNAYLSALMLRYWYKIYEWQADSATLRLAPEDYSEWLRKVIWNNFLYYKTWRWEYKAICRHGRFIEWVLDENGEKIPNPYYWKIDYNAPDKMFHGCCRSIRGEEFQYHNKHKRCANNQAYSLDSMVEDAGDEAVDFINCTTEDGLTTSDGTKYIVSSLLKRQEGLEALIVDGIANRDSFKLDSRKEKQMVWNDETECEEEVEVKVETSEFNKRKLVAHLSHIDENFMKEFCSLYNIDKEEGNTLFNKLKATSNEKLYKIIEKTMNELRNDSDLLATITK